MISVGLQGIKAVGKALGMVLRHPATRKAGKALTAFLKRPTVRKAVIVGVSAAAAAAGKKLVDMILSNKHTSVEQKLAKLKSLFDKGKIDAKLYDDAQREVLHSYARS